MPLQVHGGMLTVMFVWQKHFPSDSLAVIADSFAVVTLIAAKPCETTKAAAKTISVA